MLQAEENSMIQRAARGDERAFEKLVEAYQKQVYNLALKIVKNREDALDLSQEAFLKAWRGLPGFRQEAKFSSWLYRLTYNVCLDFLRKSARENVISLTVENEGEEVVQADLPDSAPGPEKQAEDKETAETLRREVEKLPEEQKRCLLLRAVNGLEYSEIAEIMGVSVGTVKSRISRGRASLAEKMK